MDRERVETALRRLNIEPAEFTGEWVNARCPFAGSRHPKGRDTRPSFGVSVSSPSVYHCFTCKSRGALYDLPRELGAARGESYGELGAELKQAEAVGAVIRPDSYEIFEEVPSLPDQVYGDLFEPVDYEAADYAEGRGVSIDTCDRLGIMDWPEERRLMFPVRGFDGQLYGWTGRAYDEAVKPKVWNMKGMNKASHLLGAEQAEPDIPMVLVEGLFAYARFHDMGIPEQAGVSVAAVMGSAVSGEQADLLSQWAAPVILFLDGDKAGREGTWGTEKREGAAPMLARVLSTRVVTYPGRVADPDDLSAEEVLGMIESARPVARRRTRAS